MTLGQRIKNIRQTKSMSQKALANKSFITASHLCLIEKDKASPSIDTLKHIASALEVSLGQLLIDEFVSTTDESDSREITFLIENLPPADQKFIKSFIHLYISRLDSL